MVAELPFQKRWSTIYRSRSGDTYSLCLSGKGHQIPPFAADAFRRAACTVTCDGTLSDLFNRA
jgi:hypothetical protein